MRVLFTPDVSFISTTFIDQSRQLIVTKKSFPLRINEQVIAAMQRWADDDLRSVNAQIEFVLREALVKSGRVKITQKVVTDVELLSADNQKEE